MKYYSSIAELEKYFKYKWENAEAKARPDIFKGLIFQPKYCVALERDEIPQARYMTANWDFLR